MSRIRPAPGPTSAAGPAPPTEAVSLVPPQPNLGPEPWEATPLPWPWVVGFGLGVIALSLAFRGRLARLVRGQKPRRASLAGGGTDATGPATPRERIVALSVEVRDALAARFDESWRAKTTEEVAADPGLGEAIGAEETDCLLAFLRAADRVKFAPEGTVPQGDDLDAAAGWAAGFVAAGASSRITGK